MVATDTGGDDKMEDSCNGNEATTAAALVSQMGAGEPMQVDGDGNFVLPQVDGPIDDLLLEGEEKMDVDEEPASENATESTSTESAIVTEQNDVSENIQTEKSAVKEEIAVKNEETTTAESIIANQTKKVEDVDNPSIGDQVSMETNADDAELPIEKEIKDSEPIIDDAKVITSELPVAQSSTETSSVQTPLADIANSATEIDETRKDENSLAENIKSESLSGNEKPVAPENLTEDTNALQSPQDDTQKVEKIKDEIAELESDLPTESCLIKLNDADEPMIADNSTSTPADNVTAPIVQMKLEPDDEPMEQDRDKLPDLPISSINGVATPLEKEIEKVQTPMKMEIKDDLAVSKRENLKQEKINDARSETGDDSTALTTLATAALGSAEPAMKVKNEQVNLISCIIYYYTK